MKKFIVLYYMPKEATQTTDKEPNESADNMVLWMQWAKKSGDKLIDFGTPLGNGKKIMPNGTSDSSSEVGGYSILQADNMDEATALLKDHPHLSWNSKCSIEIHESLPMEM